MAEVGCRGTGTQLGAVRGDREPTASLLSQPDLVLRDLELANLLQALMQGHLVGQAIVNAVARLHE